jgi:hypothetical protein
MRDFSSAAASRVNVTAHNRPVLFSLSNRAARMDSTRVSDNKEKCLGDMEYARLRNCYQKF